MLGVPFAPIDYQLFVHDDQPRLTWTVPSVHYVYNNIVNTSDGGAIWYSLTNDPLTARSAESSQQWVGAVAYVWATDNLVRPVGSGHAVPGGSSFRGTISYGALVWGSGWEITAWGNFGTLNAFTLQHRRSSSNSWTTIASPAGSVREYTTTEALEPQYQYRLIGHATSISPFPYNDVSIVWKGTLDLHYSRYPNGLSKSTLNWDSPPSLTGDTLGIFYLQQSFDGVTWNPVTDKTGSPGDSFSVDDYTTPNPVSYYRVLQTTGNGVVIPYNVRSVGVAGQAQWVLPMNCSGQAKTRGVAVCSNGDVVMAGSFSGHFIIKGVTYDSTPGTGPTPYGQSAFILKYRPSTDTVVWFKHFGRDQNSGNGIYAVAVDSADNCWATGVMTFVGGGVYTTIPVSDGQSLVETYVSAAQNQYTEPFLVRFASDGTCTFAKAYCTTTGVFSGSAANAISVGNDGSVVIGGWDTAGGIDFGGGVLAGSGFNQAGFVAKFTNTGSYVWATRFSGFSIVHGLAVDANGKIVVSGTMGGTASFLGTAIAATGDTDAFVLQVTSSNTLEWIKHFGSSGGNAESLAVATLSNNDPVLTGFFEHTVDFGNGLVRSTERPDQGGLAIFVLRLAAASGNSTWVNAYGGGYGGYNYSDAGLAVSVNSADQILVSGLITSTIDFGGGQFGSNSSPHGFSLTLTPAGSFVWANRIYGVVNRANCFDRLGRAVVGGGTGASSVDFTDSYDYDRSGPGTVVIGATADSNAYGLAYTQ